MSWWRAATNAGPSLNTASSRESPISTTCASAGRRRCGQRMPISRARLTRRFVEHGSLNFPAERVERLSIVVPIGIIVAIAIVCVVIAVVGAAQRADDVSLDAERRIISRALTNHSQRVLRELETVVMSDAAYRKLRIDFDME